MSHAFPYSRVHEDFFLKHGDPIRYEKGQHIVWHKDESPWVFFLTEGLVRVSFSFPDGTRRTLGYFVPGVTFAQAGSFISDTDIKIEYTAEKSLTLYRIPRDIFLLQLEHDPVFARDFLTLTLKNQMLLIERIVYLGEKGMLRKCARWILFMNKYYGKNNGDVREIVVPITQDTIAEFLHATRESVSPIIHEFEEKGYIHITKKCLSIKKAEEIAKLLT